MILDLFRSTGTTSFKGQLVRDLAELVAAGVVVVPTALLPNASFDEWKDNGRVSDSDVDQLLDWAAENVTAETGELVIRTSLDREYFGLLTRITVKPNFTAVQSGIDRVYRSWGDEGARASRMVHNIDQAESKPSLIVQGLPKKVHSVLTRHAINGTITIESDYGDNINNRLPRF